MSLSTSETKVEALTTSRVVTPKSLIRCKVDKHGVEFKLGKTAQNMGKVTTCLLGSNTPCFLNTSATIGTVELTGLEMTRTNALGAVVAIPVAKSRTMPALILKQ